MDEFYKQAGHNRWLQLQEFIGNEQIALSRYQRNGDVESASYSLQQLANAQAEMRNLQNLHDQVVASETPPPAPPPLTREEQMAKPLEKMTLEDSWNLGNTSKYGCDAEGFKRGMAEVMARRQRGQ
jgi:hypothetical protein